jgi:hypothetical protein
MNVTINNQTSAFVKLNFEMAVLICHSIIKKLIILCLFVKLCTEGCKTREYSSTRAIYFVSLLYVGSDKCKDTNRTRAKPKAISGVQLSESLNLL